MGPSSLPQQFKNRVLASLPAEDLQRLTPHLTPVTLGINRTLHDAGQLIDTVYFLEEGICSMVVTMETGNMIEVGVTGIDGFVGLAALLGTRQSPNRAFMQISGHGYSMKAKVLFDQAEGSSKLRVSLQRVVQGMLVQTSQTAACNRVHELEERMARWLLICHDRVQDDHVPITHEFLGMMLGTRRSSVTVAAGILRKAGLIAYTRRDVTIQNREGLEHASCECYRIIRNEYDRLGLS